MRSSQMHVSISGGIAVGKTTLAARLSDAMADTQCFIEQPERNCYLADFYEDMNKWAFHSRIGMLALFLSRYERLDPCKNVVLMDRSVHELITFARLHFDAGNLSSQDFSIYRSIYRGIVTLAPPLRVVVYLQCSPQVALARIHSRERPFEAKVTEAYLSEIRRYYEEWLSSLPHSTQVLRYDSDDGLPVEKVQNDLMHVLSSVSPQEET